jgi:hypothetical protein
MSQEIVTRTQYTFRASNRKIARLTELNIETTPYVNIVAMNITGDCVKIVVGTTNPNNLTEGGAGDPADPNPKQSNELQNKQFRKNLRKLNIKYSTQEIIQILRDTSVVIPGTPGIYRIYLNALYDANIPFISFYSGDIGFNDPLVKCKCRDKTSGFKARILTIFIEVPENKIRKAIKVLKKTDRSDDDDQ